MIKFLSPARLSSYRHLNEHFENLLLIGKIAPKLALIEIALRNLMDILLKQNNAHWLTQSNDELICNIKEDIIKRAKANNTLSHDQFLSRFTLGANIAVIKKCRLQDKIFHFKKLNFRDFYEGNKNYYLSKNRNKIKFKQRQQVDIVLDLLSNIRNRSFHWENLFKFIEKGQKAVPRLSINKHNTIIGIRPNKIELFLEWVLNSLDGSLLKKLDEIKGNASSPFEFQVRL